MIDIKILQKAAGSRIGALRIGKVAAGCISDSIEAF